jgi:hypothetical protein
MSRGGFRPGAGRPKKSAADSVITRAAVAKIIKSGDLTPLEYLANVMRDENLLTDVRLKAAALLLPYFHPRMAPHQVSKKELELARALAVSGRSKFGPPTAPPGLVGDSSNEDNEWGDDLAIRSGWKPN